VLTGAVIVAAQGVRECCDGVTRALSASFYGSEMVGLVWGLGSRLHSSNHCGVCFNPQQTVDCAACSVDWLCCCVYVEPSTLTC
jgi:hypothetical protein